MVREERCRRRVHEPARRGTHGNAQALGLQEQPPPKDPAIMPASFTIDCKQQPWNQAAPVGAGAIPHLRGGDATEEILVQAEGLRRNNRRNNNTVNASLIRTPTLFLHVILTRTKRNGPDLTHRFPLGGNRIMHTQDRAREQETPVADAGVARDRCFGLLRARNALTVSRNTAMARFKPSSSTSRWNTARIRLGPVAPASDAAPVEPRNKARYRARRGRRCWSATAVET